MSTDAERLLAAVLELSDQERAEVVLAPLDSLEPDVPGLDRGDDEWIAEIERRAQAALAGSPSVSWDDARRHVEERLRRQ